jgi:hypothetical protein
MPMPLGSCQHFRGRIPVRPFLLGVNGRHAGPDKPFGADADAVTDGLAAALYQVEEMTSRIDHDRPRRFGRWVSHDGARECRIRSARLFSRGAEEVAGRVAADVAGRAAADQGDQNDAGKTTGDDRARTRQAADLWLHTSHSNAKRPRP